MACIDSCAKGVLSFYISEDGYYQIKIDSSKCVDCGLCTKVCPVLNKPIVKEVNRKHAFAVWDKNEGVRCRAASGGAFSAIASVVLEQGGVVYGAAIEGFRVKHIRINSINDLHKLQGSKYQQSEVLGVYKQARKDLREGLTVLFSGMSCQIAGLVSYLGKTDRIKLYTIDTVCGGTSTMLPMLQLEQNGIYKEITSFRDKSEGWKPRGFQYSLKMLEKNGVIDNLGTQNLVIKSFCSPLLKRASCTDCKFNGMHRISDCTICDFWGIEDYKEQHDNGISGLIVNNPRINILIESSTLELHQMPLKSILDNNPPYYWNKHGYLLNSRKRTQLLRLLKEGNTKEFMKLLKAPADLLTKILARINYSQKKKCFKRLLKK